MQQTKDKITIGGNQKRMGVLLELNLLKEKNKNIYIDLIQKEENLH